MFMGLVPIVWLPGIGADTVKRMAAPMIGGRLPVHESSRLR